MLKGVIITQVVENFKLKKRRRILFVIFPLIFIYFECVFRLSTQGSLLTFGTLAMVFFSASLGYLLYIIVNIFKNPKINYIITIWP